MNWLLLGNAEEDLTSHKFLITFDTNNQDFELGMGCKN